MISDKNQISIRYTVCCKLLHTPNSTKDAAIVDKLRALLEEAFCQAPNTLPSVDVYALKERLTQFASQSTELTSLKSHIDLALLKDFLIPLIPLRSDCLQRLPELEQKWSLAPSKVETILKKPAKALDKEDIVHLSTVRAMLFINLQAFAAVFEMLDQHHFSYETHKDLQTCNVCVMAPEPNSKAKEGIQNLEQYSAEKLQIAIRVNQLAVSKSPINWLQSTVEDLVADILDLEQAKKLSPQDVKMFLKMIEFTQTRSAFKQTYAQAVDLYQRVKKIFMSTFVTPTEHALKSFVPLQAEGLFFGDTITTWSLVADCIENLPQQLKLENPLEAKEQAISFLLEKFRELINTNRQLLISKIRQQEKQLVELYQKVHDKIEEAFAAKKIQKAKIIASFRTIVLYGTKEGGEKVDTVWKDLKPPVFSDIFQKIYHSQGKSSQSLVAKAVTAWKEQREKTLQLPPIEVLQIAPKLSAVNEATRPSETATKAVTAAPFEPEAKPIVYHARVLRWNEDNAETNPFLFDPTYSTQAYKPETMHWIRAQHNFASIVDRIALEEGIRIKNQIALIGEMMIKGRTQKGIFSYVFDENNVCYHRYFTIKKDADLVDLAAKGFYELDFPPLGEPALSPKSTSKQVKEMAHDKSKLIEMTKCIISIEDPKNEAFIRICRLKALISHS